MDPSFPGATLADRYQVAFASLVVRDGRTIGSETYTPAAGCRPVAADPILWLGCLSKPITAAAVMLLMDRGALALADPLCRFMPDLPMRLGMLTVRELLAHMTRLPRNMPDWKSFFEPAWLAEPLRSAAQRVCEPEASIAGRRSYSSVGYLLLGRLIEVVSACEFAAFVATELFEPLQMSDTFSINTLLRRQCARVVPVLARTGGTVSVAFEPAANNAVVNSMPFASFFSTPRDIGRFVQMILDHGSNGRRNLLREETVARMFHEEVVGQGIHQGIAWFLSFSAERGGAGHGREPCGFWHTSSSGGLIAASWTERTVVVILGQALLEDDLRPIRVAQWQYAGCLTMTAPTPVCAPLRTDAPQWLEDLGSAFSR